MRAAHELGSRIRSPYFYDPSCLAKPPLSKRDIVAFCGDDDDCLPEGFFRRKTEKRVRRNSISLPATLWRDVSSPVCYEGSYTACAQERKARCSMVLTFPKYESTLGGLEPVILRYQRNGFVIPPH